MKPTTLLYNPRSTSPGKQRLPLSLLSLGAVLEPDYDFEIVDGNLVPDPATAIVERVRATGARVLGVTVMPGPQLSQAVPVCRDVKAALPDLTIIWGGYFPTQHYAACLRSAYVDYVIQGQGEKPFRALVDCLHNGGAPADVPSLVYRANGDLAITPRAIPTPLDDLPRFPYHRLDVERYIQDTYLGTRCLPHNSSFGCPFACNFCAVVALSQRRWLAESPARMENSLRFLAESYGVNAIEFHDMDFFVSETRTAEFAERIADLGFGWWGLGRVDTLMGYSDATWAKMKASGCKMVFMGAESGSDEVLARMNKGGRAATDKTLALVARMREVGIVPELSFVLGNPPDPHADVDASIRFIRQIKQLNPATEIVIYIYTPVPEEGTLLDEATSRASASRKRWTNGWAVSGMVLPTAATPARPGSRVTCGDGCAISKPC